MFGFGTKRRYKKTARKIGAMIHRQILDALVRHKKLFQTPEEVAFSSGYLKSFFWGVLNRQGCNDMTLQVELLRQTCETVSPGRLWAIYERGAALADPLSKRYRPGCTNAYELGVSAGLNDAEEVATSQVYPVNLTRYLLGKRLLGPAFTVEDVLQFKAGPAPLGEKREQKSQQKISAAD